MFDWNSTSFNFTINVTNCGDFWLNLVQVNETYHANLSYSSSNITPSNLNQTFNITQIAPGITTSFYIIMNVSGPLDNSTRIWNNITIDSNETDPLVFENTSWMVGVQTEAVRIRYTAELTNMATIGDRVLGILGVLLIIGSIFLIVLIVRRSGLLGGGE